MNSQQVKKLKLPDKPGVYFFLGSPTRFAEASARRELSEGGQKGKGILYIGKATSLRDRVRSYFPSTTLGEGRLLDSRGPMILDMVTLATGIKWQETDSVLEALILEANLIKKYQPKYNTKEKDNKSFNYVCITDPARLNVKAFGGEKIPKVLIVRGRNLNKNLYKNIFGPFPNGQQLKEAMKIIRRIFPYIDNQSSKKNNFEFYRQLNLIPPLLMEEGVGGGDPEVKHHLALKGTPPRQGGEKYKWLISYKKNIKNLILFFQGKKKRIISNLKKEMIEYAKKREFEKAGEIKKKIFALEHINDVALIKEENITQENFERYNSPHPTLPLVRGGQGRGLLFRIESYDIAHMSGKNMVGVMTVIEDGEIKKSEYKKFIIRSQNNANDTGALKEVLARRFKHTEWRFPNLIVVDGGQAQLNVAKKVLQNFVEKKTTTKSTFEKVLARLPDSDGQGRGGREPVPDHFQKHFLFTSIMVVSVLKDDKHKAKAIVGDEEIIKKYKKEILLANSEAHRFAIIFHKNRRNKNFLI